ncbi:amiloride-sensitive sodium channel subunit alpha-like [Hydra vulgaris]|uniref:Hydra sodium channel 12 n=1 Tax=Hydra vulgaris TaxID=6087 RepID=A0A0A0MP74_HYDVU|nr:amiloride-sensitive sodium channel subunit alpha-like [Hydra vulgaris]CDG50533.1 Hydra sodium channel 12 [Hydra vulgaris]
MDYLNLLERIRSSKVRRINKTSTDKEFSVYDNLSIRENFQDKMKTIRTKLHSSVTSAHGCLMIFKPKTKLGKLMWFFVILCCFFFCIVNLVKITRDYSSENPEVKILELYEKSPTFPVVVICNENALNSSIKEHIISLTGKKLDQFDSNLKKYITHKNFNSRLFNEFGNRLNSTLVSCTIGVDDCSTLLSWYQIWHLEYGLCFAFNSGFNIEGNEVTTRRVFLPGYSHGLNLNLKLEKNEYNDKSKTTALRVFITHQGEYLFPPNEDLLLTSGFYYSISFQKRLMNREYGSNKMCRKDKIIKLSNFSLSQPLITKYTQNFCNLNCLSEEIARECMCVEYDRPVLEQHAKIPKCNVDASTQSCIKQQYSYWKSGSSECLQKCKLECFEVKYEPRIHLQKYCSNDLCEGDLKLSVNFRSFNYFFYQVHINHVLAEFLGHAGGIITFLTGFSIISFIEASFITMQLVITILYMRCKSFKKSCDKTITSRKSFVTCQASLEV